MKKILLSLLAVVSFASCKTASQATSTTSTNEVKVTINLNNVVDDKVQVTMFAPTITTNETTFFLPKIIPGTYSEDDYGKLIEDVKAFDNKGNLLEITKLDVNSFKIANAQKLSRITYWVNDTFDQEKSVAVSYTHLDVYKRQSSS